MIPIAIKAAKAAGKIITENYNKNFEIQTKDGNKRNLVTSIDLAAEKEIIAIIKKDFPDHDILSEEKQPDQNKISKDFVWIIDPIDGTTNFTRGIKDVTVAIAAAKNDTVILGVVYNPFSRELFSAEEGKGAFLNGVAISVSRIESLEDIIVTQSFAYSSKFRKDPLKNINNLFLKVNGLRLYHSTALELCYLAAGRIDACIISGSNPWDIAAGSLIVEEAGGKITKFSGEPWEYLNGRIIATNKIIHQDLLNLING